MIPFTACQKCGDLVNAAHEDNNGYHNCSDIFSKEFVMIYNDIIIANYERDKLKKSSYECCPVNQCIKRVLNTDRHLSVYEERCKLDGKIYSYDNPELVKRWIIAYDGGNLVCPITFKLRKYE